MDTNCWAIFIFSTLAIWCIGALKLSFDYDYYGKITKHMASVALLFLFWPVFPLFLVWFLFKTAQIFSWKKWKDPWGMNNK